VSLRHDLDGSHPLTGRSAPDFELVDGRKIGALLRNGKGLLLDFDGSPPLAALASRWRDRIAYVASDATDRLGLSAVLVRPDGFVAWAGEADPNLEEAAEAASRWFGEPPGAGTVMESASGVSQARLGQQERSPVMARRADARQILLKSEISDNRIVHRECGPGRRLGL
jgi:hypothetical protein